jgi:hypothetical protein
MIFNGYDEIGEVFRGVIELFDNLCLMKGWKTTQSHCYDGDGWGGNEDRL